MSAKRRSTDSSLGGSWTQFELAGRSDCPGGSSIISRPVPRRASNDRVLLAGFVEARQKQHVWSCSESELRRTNPLVPSKLLGSRPEEHRVPRGEGVPGPR